jgi:hypothetical protein
LVACQTLLQCNFAILLHTAFEHLTPLFRANAYLSLIRRRKGRTQGMPTMSFAPAIWFFAPDKEFFPPRKKPVRRALPPPPPPGDAPKENFKERICQRLLALNPIVFMVGVLLMICAAVVGLWGAMGLVLPL